MRSGAGIAVGSGRGSSVGFHSLDQKKIGSRYAPYTSSSACRISKSVQ
jgi:hypothetical protein